MIGEGELAPEIVARTTDGSLFELSKRVGLCTVIYFYPAAFTPGCTAETKRGNDET